MQATWVALAACVSQESNNWLHIPNSDIHLDRETYSTPAGGFCADNNAFQPWSKNQASASQTHHSLLTPLIWWKANNQQNPALHWYNTVESPLFQHVEIPSAISPEERRSCLKIQFYSSTELWIYYLEAPIFPKYASILFSIENPFHREQFFHLCFSGY